MNKLWPRLTSGLLLGFFVVFANQPRDLSAADNPAPAGPEKYTIEQIQGSQVQVLEEGAAQWEAAEEGQEVEAGDEVKTGADSEVSLMLGDETSVHLSGNTDLKVDRLSANQAGGFLSRLKMLAGRMLADVKKNLQDSQSSFEVESNGVVCGVRGTAFEVDAQGDDAQVTTHEGKVEVDGGGETHLVTEGNASSFRHGRFQLLRRLNQMEIQRFQRWRELRRIVRQRRIQRLAAIRNHARRPWIRRHPRLNSSNALIKKDLEKKRAKRRLLRKRIRPEAP